MVLLLRIAGPGLDVVRRLESGEEQLVLGRDAECDVRLPDPQRNVSRRHLSIWLEGDQLKFHVLSEVNGIEMPFGEAPPGARGVLPPGQTLRVGDYSISAAALAEPPPAPSPADPWAELERAGAGVAAAPAPPAPSLADQTGGASNSAVHEEDPFGEWGFEVTYKPDTEQDTGQVEPGGLPGGMPAFFQGLGLEPGSIGGLSEGEVEAMGRLVRILVLGVLELHASAAVAKQEMSAEDRTMMPVQHDNPLRTGWPEERKLRYMFGGRAAGVGFINPERALRHLLAELVAHTGASGAGARATLESTLKEFAPETLKSRLLPGKPKLFEAARAWDAYCKYYAQEGHDLRQWTQRQLDRYFAEAYLRESLRIRRETRTHRADGSS